MKLWRCTMPLLLLAAVNMAGAANRNDWRDDAPCGRQLPVEKTQKPGCELAVAAQLPGGVEFSVCRARQSMQTGEMQASLQRGGQLLRQWTVSIIPPALLDGDNEPDSGFPVRVDALDLNGDGQEEILLAVMNNLSLGMTVSSWSIWVFDGTGLSQPIKTQEYGALSFPICPADGRGKFLLVGQWRDGWEPHRGRGLYFSACWAQPARGGDTWFPATSRPAVYRRYLSRFEQIRRQAITSGTPAPWHRSAQTKIVTGPWACPGM